MNSALYGGVMKHLLPMVLLAAACLLAAGQAGGQAGQGKSAAQTRVLDDHVPVYTRMSTSGGVIHELSKGDRVEVQFEMEKSSISWCSIVHEGETTLSGYVECRHLERRSRRQWELIKNTGTPPSSPYLDTTRVRVVNRQVLVPVNLNYRGVEVPVDMLLDTGASGTVIKAEVARRLGLDLEGAINIKAMVMGGGTINVKMVQLTGMTVGPHRVDGPVIGVFEHAGAPVSFDGVLGMDFLGTVAYQVDLNQQVINWTK